MPVSRSSLKYTDGDGGEVVFAEDGGLAYVMSSIGRRQETRDPHHSDVVLRKFGHDEKGNLTTITDPRSDDRVTTIERDNQGVPTAIISPDRLRTELIIDENNQLTHISHPGSDSGALVDLGDYWERRRNFDSALELYDKAIALLRGKICGECPDELEYAYHVKICLLEETGRPEEAERCLREALRLCPDSDLLRTAVLNAVPKLF